MLNKDQKPGLFRRIIDFWHVPTRLMMGCLPCHNHRKKIQTCIGLSLVLFGSFLTSIPMEVLPHYLWDGLAYSVHGFGLAPLIKVSAELLNIDL